MDGASSRIEFDVVAQLGEGEIAGLESDHTSTTAD